jgi:hypothetical protein
MEKYIIILVLLASIYYIQNKLKETEGFEGTTQNTTSGIDDTNAINTLAQIAKNLMAGGVTVPGNITVKGSIATGDTPGQTPGTIISNMGDSWGMLWGSHCALIGQKGKPMRFGFADAYNAAGWDEKVNIQPDGTLNVKTDETIGGNLITNGSIATGGSPGLAKGSIISNMGDSWGMLWGSHCALIGQKGKPMRFGFADAYNASGWDEKMRIQPDGSLIVNGRNILAELDDLKAQAVRKDKRFFINVHERRNGDRCCWVGHNLIVHGDGKVQSWGEPSQQTIFSFLQV